MVLQGGGESMLLPVVGGSGFPAVGIPWGQASSRMPLRLGRQGY